MQPDGTWKWVERPFEPFYLNPPPPSIFDEGFVSYKDSALKKGELCLVREQRRAQAAAKRAQGYKGGFQHGGLRGNPVDLSAAYGEVAATLAGGHRTMAQLLGDGFPGANHPGIDIGSRNPGGQFQAWKEKIRLEEEERQAKIAQSRGYQY